MNNKLLRKILLENIINAGLVVIGLTLVEMFYHLSGWNPESYFIHSKGVVAKFGLDVVFPITIEQTLYRFIASVLDYFFLRIDDKKIAYNDTEQFNNWLVPSTDWRDKKENEYYTLYTWKGFGFLYLLGLKLPVYVSKRIVSEQFGKQGVYQIQMTHFMHLAVAVKKYPIESELLTLDDTISDLQWDIRKLERNLEVYQGESRLSDRDREIKGEFEREFAQKQKELQTLLQRKSELEKQLPEEQCSGKQNAGDTDYSEEKHGR